MRKQAGNAGLIFDTYVATQETEVFAKVTSHSDVRPTAVPSQLDSNLGVPDQMEIDPIQHIGVVQCGAHLLASQCLIASCCFMHIMFTGGDDHRLPSYNEPLAVVVRARALPNLGEHERPRSRNKGDGISVEIRGWLPRALHR